MERRLLAAVALLATLAAPLPCFAESTDEVPQAKLKGLELKIGKDGKFRELKFNAFEYDKKKGVITVTAKDGTQYSATLPDVLKELYEKEGIVPPVPPDLRSLPAAFAGAHN